MIQGFDVSHWQGSVDWAKLKARHSIEFGIAKATEGTNFLDPQFKSNWLKMEAAGLIRGAYHFARPARPVQESAAFFLDTVQNAGFHDDDKLVLDLETGDGLSQATVNVWSKTWAKIVREVTGHTPIVYMGSAYLSNNTGNGFDEVFAALWYPRYPSAYANDNIFPSSYQPPVPIGSSSWVASNWKGFPEKWQFSASFTSVDGKIDANVSPLTVAQLKEIGAPDVAVTAAEIEKIAERTAEIVWKRDGFIRNGGQPLTLPDGTPNPAAYAPAAWFISNLESTQDEDHQTLNNLATTPGGSVNVTSLSTAALQDIATAVGNELASRMGS